MLGQMDAQTMGQAASPGPAPAAPAQPSGLGCCDTSTLLHRNLDRGPANSFPTTVPSSNGDGAGSGPPGSVAKPQGLRRSSVLARAIASPPLSSRLFVLDALQEQDGARPLFLLGVPRRLPVHLGLAEMVGYKKKSPSGVSARPGYHPPCDSDPRFGALLGLSAPIPLPYSARAGWS